MGLIAVRDTALGPLSAVLRRVPTLEAVETQSLSVKTINAFLDSRVDQDVTCLRLMDAASYTARTRRLLLWGGR